MKENHQDAVMEVVNLLKKTQNEEEGSPSAQAMECGAYGRMASYVHFQDWNGILDYANGGLYAYIT